MRMISRTKEAAAGALVAAGGVLYNWYDLAHDTNLELDNGLGAAAFVVGSLAVIDAFIHPETNRIGLVPAGSHLAQSPQEANLVQSVASMPKV